MIWLWNQGINYYEGRQSWNLVVLMSNESGGQTYSLIGLEVCGFSQHIYALPNG